MLPFRNVPVSGVPRRMIEAPPYELIREYLWIYRYLVERLLTLERMFPDALLTSWWRSRASNQAVGGAEFSQHRLGFAVDVSVMPGELDRFATIATGLGFVAVKYPSHVHLQVFDADTVPRRLFTV